MARDLKAQSIRLAEKITAHLDGLPWPMAVFIKPGPQGESPSVYYFRTNDPEGERFERARKGILVGTYTRAATAARVAEDVLEVLRG